MTTTERAAIDLTHATDLDALANSEPIARAARIVRRGGLVAFPTETVYGLGANALDPVAAARIFEAKQRPLNDPLIVHIAGLSELAGLTDRELISGRRADRVEALTRAFWPGPLTLVLPRAERVPLLVTAGADTVAVRMPNHPVALALIRASGVPIAAPSANRFGHVSPTTAQHVLDDLAGRIDLVLDGGATPIGLESTVLDVTDEPPRILRPGGLAREAIESVIGDVSFEPRAAEQLRSPGLLDKHYAPRAKLEVCADVDAMLARHSALAQAGARVGLLVSAQQRARVAESAALFVLGATDEDIARNLYAGLRALDAAGVDAILVCEVGVGGLADAIRDRLRRAAS